MNWFEARTWAAQLVYGGDDDWRLPTAWNRDGSPPSYGFYHGSELGHLSYDELGGTGGPYPYGKPLLTDNNNPNLALFTNIMDSGPNPYWAVHWSGT